MNLSFCFAGSNFSGSNFRALVNTAWPLVNILCFSSLRFVPKLLLQCVDMLITCLKIFQESSKLNLWCSIPRWRRQQGIHSFVTSSINLRLLRSTINLNLAEKSIPKMVFSTLATINGNCSSWREPKITKKMFVPNVNKF